MSSTVFFVLVIIVCLEISAAAKHSICQGANVNQTINWERLSKMNQVWYDVADAPVIHSPIDCYDWIDFSPIENGVRVIVRLQIAGGSGEHTITHEFLRDNDGYYRGKKLDEKGQRTNVASYSKVITEEEELAEYIADLEIYYKIKLFFLTDYDDYFVLGACLPGGELGAYMKFSHQRPSIQDLAKVWNRFSDLNASPRIALKPICIKRRHGQKIDHNNH